LPIWLVLDCLPIWLVLDCLPIWLVLDCLPMQNGNIAGAGCTTSGGNSFDNEGCFVSGEKSVPSTHPKNDSAWDRTDDLWVYFQTRGNFSRGGLKD
jgi:hypothetical protein